MRASWIRGLQDDWDHPVTSHMRLSVAQATKKGVLYLPRNDMQRLTKYLSQERNLPSQSIIGTSSSFFPLPNLPLEPRLIDPANTIAHSSPLKLQLSLRSQKLLLPYFQQF